LPKIEEAKQIHLDSSWFSSERDVTRTKGIHLSHVIDYIEFLQGKRKEVQQGPMSDAGNAFAAGGFAWERILENIIEQKPTDLWDWLYSRALNEPENPLIVRPGEQCMDAGVCPLCKGKGNVYKDLASPVTRCTGCKGLGRILIYLTPDGYHIEDMLLEEWKATSKSCRDIDLFGPKFKRWTLYQIPCYLKSLLLNICRLRVYFVRGDYTNGVPQWWEFILHYSQQEIDETWDSISQHAILMVKEGVV